KRRQRQKTLLNVSFRSTERQTPIMVGSGAPGTRFSQTLLKTQERVKTHTGAILVCLLLLCFASIARSRSFP
ncbi:hypothetical protein, partial [Shigella sonnei]|uniref:hypothetical protein n=1 Tax=Shigella sonnei TaxID=624 RepID=UPI000AC6ACCC